MKDSQGTLLVIGDKLKSSESKECIPAIELIKINGEVGVFKWLINPFKKPFNLTQKSLTNSTWIVTS